MANITAQIVADSLSTQGIRITTFLLRYPRFVHAELMTHRVFSRNASSSRAIPVKKLIDDIRKEPATFEYWGRNEKGMQANTELTGFALWAVQTIWIATMWIMTTLALLADKLGAHKQTVNRMVEPWSHITVVVTSTDYGNWFALRDHKDAMPEIMHLAKAMQEEYLHNQPEQLLPGEWHLPFVDYEAKMQIFDHMVNMFHTQTGAMPTEQTMREGPWTDTTLELSRQVSVSRCARTSYKTHDSRTASVLEELGLYSRLIERTPLHASPTEHQATPDREEHIIIGVLNEDGSPRGSPEQTVRWQNPHQHGNFTGWRQFRKMLPGENQADAPHKYDWLVKKWRESEDPLAGQ